jgi:hypothetical protein
MAPPGIAKPASRKRATSLVTRRLYARLRPRPIMGIGFDFSAAKAGGDSRSNDRNENLSRDYPQIAVDIMVAPTGHRGYRAGD